MIALLSAILYVLLASFMPGRLFWVLYTPYLALKFMYYFVFGAGNAKGG